MKMLFDATALSYYYEKNGHRAGIFQTTLNLLKEFRKNNIDIDLYCDFSRYYYLKNVKEFADLKIITDNSVFAKLLGFVSYMTRNSNKYINYAFIVLSRMYAKYINGFYSKKSAKFKNYNAYFSSYTPPSKEIENSDIKKFRMILDVIPIIENGLNKTSKQWYYWFNRVYSTINETDFYFTDSEYTKQDVLKYFPFIKEENIKTALLGADESFKPSEKPSPIDGKYIFSLCTLGKRKNLEFGIRNFFKFIEKNNINDLKLVLGGSVWNRYKSKLDSILEDYDKSKIVLTGYIESQDLPEYYSNALCFIYPSLYEGFGLPVLEAMQCGCPVISSNRTSLPEVIGDAGIQINPENDDDMVKAYEIMYYNSEFRAECREKGLNRALQFSWEKCAKEIIDFIYDKTNVQ